MSTFIHNEPTSLSILQELKLPQTFLASIKQHIPFSPEVVSAIPTAYGAICLNQAGLDMYNAIPTMDPFLEIFTTESYLRPLLDNEVPQLIGTSLDELMRHQTSLKEGIIESVVRLVRRVNEIGLGFAPNAKEDSALSVKSSTDDETTSDERDRKDSLICQYIDVVSRVGFVIDSTTANF